MSARRRAAAGGAKALRALGAFALACAAFGGPTAQAADAPPAACREPGLPHEVRCGSVSRPLDPARPEGVQIQVHYVVVPALARHRLPDPVVLLAGGPGQSAIALAPQVMPLFSRLNQRRDVVFVDQRGTGRSAPLDCEAPVFQSLEAAADAAHQRAELRACRERLQALPHGDLRQYTTTIAMADLDAVRRALGVAQMNLVGVSYGTRAALEYLRQFPQAVRRTLLDGVAPPDMVLPESASADAQAVFDALFAACAPGIDESCARRHPRLREDWERLLASLPREVQARHPLTGRDERFLLDRDALLQGLRGPLYAPAVAAALPQAIADAAQGRFGGLLGLASLGVPRGPAALAVGQHLSVICSEDLPRAPAPPETPGRDFGEQMRRQYREACADWPRGRVPAAFYEIPSAPSPVLLMAGTLDPVTPPRHAEHAAQALGSKARLRVVPNAGHGLLMLPCMREVLWGFVTAETEAGALAVDADCAAGVPRPPAFVPLGAEEARP